MRNGLWHRRLSRRELLALGGSALATSLIGCGDPRTEAERADEGAEAVGSGESVGPMRIGAILPPAAEPSYVDASIIDAVAEAARMGTEMAQEEHAFSAELLGIDLEVTTLTATDGGSAFDAAERLVAENQITGLIGGFDRHQAMALSRFANDREVVFMNIGSADDALRHEACGRFTFHIEPSAAMYLDALAGWFVRAGFRNWFFVHEATDSGEALYRRALQSLAERHFGAGEAGSASVEPGAMSFGDSIAAAGDTDPDVVLLLLNAEAQLGFLRQFEGAGVDAAVTGLPDSPAQTRAFYAASREAAPISGSGYRAAAWEPTLDAYGARELNARFRARWGRPMDAPAWASYQGVKILYEAALLPGRAMGPALVNRLESSDVVFDTWKGIGTSFRPWDHQLRQPLYLVEIRPDAEEAWDLAMLVGELPAIYMPGTDPVERLDQLGDLRGESRCRF